MTTILLKNIIIISMLASFQVNLFPLSKQPSIALFKAGNVVSVTPLEKAFNLLKALRFDEQDKLFDAAKKLYLKIDSNQHETQSEAVVNKKIVRLIQKLELIFKTVSQKLTSKNSQQAHFCADEHPHLDDGDKHVHAHKTLSLSQQMNTLFRSWISLFGVIIAMTLSIFASWAVAVKSRWSRFSPCSS